MGIHSKRRMWVVAAIAAAGTGFLVAGVWLARVHGRAAGSVAIPRPVLAADLRDPSRLLIGTAKGLYESSDGGRSSRRAVGLPSQGRFSGVLFDPARAALCLALSDQGLFRSEDAGRSWTRMTGLPLSGARQRGDGADRPSEELADGEAPEEALPATGAEPHVSMGQGIFRSLDTGWKWEHLPAEKSWSGTGNRAKLQEAAVSKTEPSVQQVQRVAMAYAEVGPEKIRRWRGLARWSAFVPSFTLGLNQDRDATIVSSTSAGLTKFTAGPDHNSRKVDFGFTWHLADFIWSPDQTSIDVRSRLTTQLRQEMLEEVTRLYFERKRLLAEFEAQPIEDPTLRKERGLRVQELTAYLDALTGGWFSEHLEPS